ncbi:unnamed protein product [Miscanthus lutarioriparius]|uniref:Uncharacterized protein n=1 Tax=Miscanthus lutarioriparius TaxID=422564 RepID=A0A811QJK6_9POAL|nr:unnamed protein product [Miscanthus lutarioriparius]
MAGGEGSPRRRTAKSVEAAATGPMRRCSTKRKSGKEEASGRMPRPRASGRKETAAASASACADAEKSAGVKNLLSAKDIRWILAQKPEAPPPTYQALKRSNPELVPRPGEEEDKKLCGLYVLARAFYEVEERLPKLQKWMRSELKEKGYVEVDDEWFKRKAEAQARIDRDWPSVRAKIDALWGPSGDGDESESDSDEEDEDALDSVTKDYM